MSGHRATLYRRHVRVRDDILTRRRVRQPRHLRYNTIRTVRNDSVHHVSTCCHHGTRVHQVPDGVSGVRRRRWSRTRVRRVRRRQPHVRVAQIRVTVRGAESRVYVAHARQITVGDALQVDVGQIVELEGWTRARKLMGLKRVQLETCGLQTLTCRVQGG